MTLIPMALSATEAKARLADDPTTAAADRPRYPWGLTLTLEDETLTKLGLGLDRLDVGAVVTVTARATVTGVRAEARQAGTDRHVELQITDLAIDTGAPPDDAATAQALYNRDAAGE